MNNPTSSSSYDPIASLSFIRKEKAGFNYWSVDASSLDYCQQCQLGAPRCFKWVMV